MLKTDRLYQTYVDILKEELIPAMGCTEPIAVAYAAATLRDLLGGAPESVVADISGSIIKNVKSVIVPNTGHQKGIETSIAAGIVAGKAERCLEVIAEVPASAAEAIRAYRESTPITVRHVERGHVFDIELTGVRLGHTARVRIADFHTNIVLMELDGKVTFEMPLKSESEAGEGHTDRSAITMETIWDFAMTCDLADVREILDRQIDCNMAIAREGLRGNYGANIGKVLLNAWGDRVDIKARAYAAAGSDARMNGCELPVIINSGSGNQGITASVPVAVYAEHLGKDHDTLLRALVLSNLTAIHQKTRIGRLSAYCGAVNAAAGAGCGITYLMGGDYDAVIHTLVNALAVVSGIICDGAKASCAAKIASAIDAGLLGYAMYTNGQQFVAGDGIVSKGVEANIVNVGRLGRDGMRETNNEIIDIMIGE